MHYQLELSEPKSVGRYKIKRIKGEYFKINDVYSSKSFCSRGDKIYIQYNEIKLDYNLENNKFENHLPSKRITRSNLPILIQGETGTGKTHLAKEIHIQSEKMGSFVHLNLSSFSTSLLESEIFGHVKGAFTGAMTDKKGAIAEAEGGTLFLDEIDSLPIDIQTKLLLFLDSHKVRAVGGCRDKKHNVRLIYASGSNLKDAVNNKEMRRDFYYRLSSGHEISLPSLREKPELIKNVVKNFMQNEGVAISRLLIDFYLKQLWPGNIRQLLGHLEMKKVIHGKSLFKIEEEDLALVDENIINVGELACKKLEDVKSDYVFNIYNKLNRDINRSAEVLGIAKNTVRVLLGKYQMKLAPQNII